MVPMVSAGSLYRRNYSVLLPVVSLERLLLVTDKGSLSRRSRGRKPSGKSTRVVHNYYRGLGEDVKLFGSKAHLGCLSAKITLVNQHLFIMGGVL